MSCAKGAGQAGFKFSLFGGSRRGTTVVLRVRLCPAEPSRARLPSCPSKSNATGARLLSVVIRHANVAADMQSAGGLSHAKNCAAADQGVECRWRAIYADNTLLSKSKRGVCLVCPNLSPNLRLTQFQAVVTQLLSIWIQPVPE